MIYQQIENHLLQPLIYGRTVRLSPLLALLAVLLGAEIAAVLGALGAIPIAASIQAVIGDLRQHRHGQSGLAQGDGEVASHRVLEHAAQSS